MKIAIVTSGILPIPPVRGGAVENLINFYIDYNEQVGEHEVTVLSCDDVDLSQISFSNYKHTHFIYIPTKSFIYRFRRFIFKCLKRDFYYGAFLDYYAYSLIKCILWENYDVVIIENRPGFVPFMKKVISAPLVLHLHNDTIFSEVKGASEIVEACAGVVTVSDYIRDRVLSVGNIPKEKIATVYNGVDLSKFPSVKSGDKVLLRERWGFAKDDFIAVYIGRIDPIKGVSELLDAFVKISSNYKKIKLLIVGNANFGDDKDSDFSTYVKGKAETLGQQVSFTGFIPYEEVPSILSFCDIGVVPSICEEAFSMAAIESLAMGLPLLVTRSGGIPEVVDTDCAIIIEKNHALPSVLAEKIIWLYENPNVCSKMSNAAYQRAKRFDKEIYVKQLFQKVMDFSFG